MHTSNIKLEASSNTFKYFNSGIHPNHILEETCNFHDALVSTLG